MTTKHCNKQKSCRERGMKGVCLHPRLSSRRPGASCPSYITRCYENRGCKTYLAHAHLRTPPPLNKRAHCLSVSSSCTQALGHEEHPPAAPALTSAQQQQQQRKGHKGKVSAHAQHVKTAQDVQLLPAPETLVEAFSACSQPVTLHSTLSPSEPACSSKGPAGSHGSAPSLYRSKPLQQQQQQQQQQQPPLLAAVAGKAQHSSGQANQSLPPAGQAHNHTQAGRHGSVSPQAPASAPLPQGKGVPEGRKYAGRNGLIIERWI